MEYCKNGSVFDILRKAEAELIGSAGGQQQALHTCCSYLSWDRRLMMLHNVAAGMSYLHGRSHVHADLRSTNLFVGADGMVKIGDFGFTRRLARDSPSLKVARITHPRWVAPELLTDNILSPASDVFSFGVVMYELLTFKVPFEGLRKEQVVLEVMRGARPEVPEEDLLPPGTSSSTCLWSYVRLMEACWAQDPAARPTFEAIARRIKAMQRWRRVISRLRPVDAEAAACRAQSMPASRAGAVGADGGSTDNTPPARRGLSAPTAAQQQQQKQQQQQQGILPARQAVLSSQLLRPPPLGQQRQAPLAPSAGLGSLGPDVDLGAAAAQYLHSPRASLGASAAAAAMHACTADATSSLCSAVVGGRRLAIIPTCPAVGELDALASVADPAQIAAARVLLVASDLPSHYCDLAAHV